MFKCLLPVAVESIARPWARPISEVLSKENTHILGDLNYNFNYFDNTEVFFSAFHTVVALSQKYVQRANDCNSFKRKSNYDTCKYRCDALEALGCRPLSYPPLLTTLS